MKLLVLATVEEIKEQANLIPALFEAGLETMHLRTVQWDRDRFRAFISAIPLPFHSRLVIHRYYHLAETFNLKGIHLTEASRASGDYRPILQAHPDLHVSASFHSLQDLRLNTVAYDYTFLSPVFDSLSKAGHKSTFDPAELQSFLVEMKALGKSPVYALGGVEEKNLSRLKGMGFDGAVLNGGIWKTDHRVESYRRMRQDSRE